MDALDEVLAKHPKKKDPLDEVIAANPAKQGIVARQMFGSIAPEKAAPVKKAQARPADNAVNQLRKAAGKKPLGTRNSEPAKAPPRPRANPGSIFEGDFAPDFKDETVQGPSLGQPGSLGSWITAAAENTRRTSGEIGDLTRLLTRKALGPSRATETLADTAAAIAQTPTDMVAQGIGVLDPEATLEERIANILATGANIAVPAFAGKVKLKRPTSPALPEYQGLQPAVQKHISHFDRASAIGGARSTKKGTTSARPHGYREGYTVIKPARMETEPTVAPRQSGGTTKPYFTEPPTQTPPKPAAAGAVEPPKGQGIAHADVDALRNDLGWRPRTTTSKPDTQLMADAQKHVGKEHAIAEQVITDPKKTLADEESIALGVRLKNLKAEMEKAKAANNVDVFDIADVEAQKIADALDESGSRQGANFRARRFLLDDQFDSWTVNRRAKKANLDQDLAPKRQTQLDARVKELEAANAKLAAEAEEARKQYQILIDAHQSKRSKGPMTTEQKRNAALTSLKKLGIPVADDVTPTAPVTGGMKGKQAGAVRFPGGVTEQVAREVRSLVRTYADEGAADWGGVLQRLKRDLPGIEEEQALFILSGKYKVAKLEADIARKKTYEFMRDVRREAEFRTKGIASKAVSLAWDAINTTQRSLQTTLDNSMALIQGKNVLTWKPGTWFKSVGTSLKAAATKDPIGFARKELVKIENDPLYGKAVQAKLGLSDLDGAFSKQEEFFAGRLENHLPGISHSKAMATVLMNKMRFDLFRKLAAQAPKDAPAEFFEDIARQINVATGKGSGRVAELLGSREAGFVFYAPRYYVSKWQHNLMQPLFTAKTAEGRKQALKMYGTQLLGYGALAKAAQLFGYETDLDPRSAKFGHAKAKDGSYSFDMFNQQSEAIRVGMQMLYGRISAKGEYTAPGEYGAYGVGDYLESKLSAGARTIKGAMSGKTYDEEQEKWRAYRFPSDFWSGFIPLSIKDMMKNRNVPGTFPASFIGANIKTSPKRNTPKKSAPPLKWVPPGIANMERG